MSENKLQPVLYPGWIILNDLLDVDIKLFDTPEEALNTTNETFLKLIAVLGKTKNERF